ncbi:unnamed protein product [Polarella glacialis]|uniref:Fatty acid hydroxylase domain-containing protein n=1 Tax=Polarella glacialis TaxID=89957 RepID=A0A813H1U2_POLGL|nr:unnamed protein product [Polarella glacialis]CAE8631725.1 unnamed protein product [Polarella glacialis]
MAMPRRISEVLFRRDMVGPSFVKFAATVTGMVLIEKVFMEFVLPHLAGELEDIFARHGKIQALFLLSAANSVVTFWGFGALMALPAFVGASRWKIQAGKSLDVQMLQSSMPLIVFNWLLGIILLPLLFAYFLPESSFDWRSPPSTQTLVRDAVVWLAIEEVWFFYSHRWMHMNKQLYAAVHKMHHKWTAPISFTAIYCHPFEHLVSNLTPLVLGPLVCGSHLAAISIFSFLGVLHTMAVHSGYWFCDDNGMHDEHHAKFNVNFGVLGVMDSLYGTYQLPGGPSQSTPGAASKAGERLGEKVE